VGWNGYFYDGNLRFSRRVGRQRVTIPGEEGFGEQLRGWGFRCFSFFLTGKEGKSQYQHESGKKNFHLESASFEFYHKRKKAIIEAKNIVP
jgi:hypothetical protein